MPTAAKSKPKSESPVAAREQLDAQAATSGPDLEAEAKEQEKTQAEELDSKLTGAGNKAAEKLQANASDNPAAARAGVAAQTATQGGFMDQLSRRSAGDALEGHFVKIDLNDKDVQKEYARVFPEDSFPDGHRGDYGVYLTPGALNPDTGIPETAIVRLRDDTNARVVVPYDALSPADAGGR